MLKNDFFATKVLPILCILVCGSLFISLLQYQVTINTKKQELADIQAQLTTQLAANEELNRSLANGENAIIEGIAREQGYAKPNERIFVDISGK